MSTAITLNLVGVTPIKITPQTVEDVMWVYKNPFSGICVRNLSADTALVITLGVDGCAGTHTISANDSTRYWLRIPWGYADQYDSGRAYMPIAFSQVNAEVWGYKTRPEHQYRGMVASDDVQTSALVGVFTAEIGEDITGTTPVFYSGGACPVWVGRNTGGSSAVLTFGPHTDSTLGTLHCGKGGGVLSGLAGFTATIANDNENGYAFAVPEGYLVGNPVARVLANVGGIWVKTDGNTVRLVRLDMLP